MRFTTLQYLTSFTLYALLSTSIVTAIPTKGRDVYAPVAKRAVTGVDSMSSSLYRRITGKTQKAVVGPRTGGPTQLKPSAKSKTPKPIVGTVCHAPPPQPRNRLQKVNKRQYTGEDVSTRNDGEEMKIKEYDPDGSHKLEAGLTMRPENILTSGSAGDLYLDPARPQIIIKHLKSRNGGSSRSRASSSSSGGSGSGSEGSTSGSSMSTSGSAVSMSGASTSGSGSSASRSGSSASMASGSSSGSYKITDEVVIREIMALIMVEQYVDYKYILDGDKIKEAWITMVKVPGKPFSGLGFSMKFGGVVRGEDTGFAKDHGFSRVNGVSPNTRIQFLDAFKERAKQEALDLATHKGIQNLDMSPGNLMAVFQGVQLTSLAIVDWEQWSPVPCVDDKIRAEIAQEIESSLMPYY